MKTLVLVNTSDRVSYARLETSLLNILDFYQFWYETIDISRTLLDSIELENVSLCIIAQEGLGKSLSNLDFSLLFKNVSAGMGLAIFDGMPNAFDPLFSSLSGAGPFTQHPCEAIEIEKESWPGRHCATQTVSFLLPVLCSSLHNLPAEWNPLLRTPDKAVCGMWRTYGKGKLALIGLSAQLWHQNYLGHGEGLDGLFRNTMLITAKKPFVFKGMAPYVTCRIDDASGSGSIFKSQQETGEGFRYLTILNDYGFIPSVGLFTRDIQKEDIPVIKKSFFNGSADFSPHAFSDPDNTDAFPIYLDKEGKEFSHDRLEAHFAEIDHSFATWGIKPSRTVNAHFFHMGLNAFPFLKARNQFFSMSCIRPGKAFADPKAFQWRPKPFGKNNFCLDFFEEDPEIFNGVSHPGEISSTRVDFDFLHGCTPFWKESSSNQIPLAVSRGVFQILRGLENLSFGCMMFHEQRVHHLTRSEWEETVCEIHSQLRNVPHIQASYDTILLYAKNRLRSTILHIDHKGDTLRITLQGSSNQTQLLSLVNEESAGPSIHFLEVPAFERSIEITFKISG
ncbi:MAG: hypothetical protein WDA18_03110 [Candidatus Ratteibacteria bacterium]